MPAVHPAARHRSGRVGSVAAGCRGICRPRDRAEYDPRAHQGLLRLPGRQRDRPAVRGIRLCTGLGSPVNPPCRWACAGEVPCLVGAAVAGVAGHDWVGAEGPGQGYRASGRVGQCGWDGLWRPSMFHPCHHRCQRIGGGRVGRAGAMGGAGGQEQPGERIRLRRTAHRVLDALAVLDGALRGARIRWNSSLRRSRSGTQTSPKAGPLPAGEPAISGPVLSQRVAGLVPGLARWRRQFSRLLAPPISQTAGLSRLGYQRQVLESGG
jgi:hypothetical protein